MKSKNHIDPTAYSTGNPLSGNAIYVCEQEGCNEPAKEYSCYCEDCIWDMLEEDMYEADEEE